MSYKVIELEDFYRRAQVEYFMATDSPLVELGVDIDITDWLKRLKSAGKPFYLSFLYNVCKAANSVPAFRQRFLDGRIIEYDNCPAAYTVALKNDAYTYNWLDTTQSYEDFIANGARSQKEIEESMKFGAPEDGLRYLWFSSTPWISFNHVNFPRSSKTYSEPIIVWGKIFDDNQVKAEDGVIKVIEKKKIPFTLLVNHALVDGIHIRKFLEKLDELLAEQKF